MMTQHERLAVASSLALAICCVAWTAAGAEPTPASPLVDCTSTQRLPAPVQGVRLRDGILRVRGTGGFTTVIVPWKKGQKPAGLAVESPGDAIVVKTGAWSVTIAPDGTLR